MKQRVLHIASLWLLVAFAFQCLVSCIYEDLDDRDGNDDGKAVLMLRTASVDSRSALEEVEKLHSLRVIILHANGTVEANFHESGLNGKEIYEHIFSVKKNETKKIYLIANEESMTGTDETLDLDNLDANPAATLEGITFTAVPSDVSGNPEFKNGIPMSACYEVTIGDEPRVEKDFYLVRAMTKFTFTFQNIRTDNVTLKEMRVSSFADKTFLFPHFTDNADPANAVGSEKFMVNAVGDYESEAKNGQFWIDWLREAIEKSEKDEYTPDEIGWIKNYLLPEGTAHEDTTGITLKGKDYVIESGETWTYPKAFYRCESNNVPAGSDSQKYAISYLSVQADRDESPKEWTIGNNPLLKLDKVKYLFRHTYVNVNIVLGQTEVVIFARIHPWIVIKPSIPLPFEPED